MQYKYMYTHMYTCILPGTIKVKITHYTYIQGHTICTYVCIHIAFEEKLPLYNLFVTFIY